MPYVAQVLGADGGPVVAATDWIRTLPDLVAPWIPAPYLTLGTDGFGRSDTREALRDHFEIDPPAIAAAALAGLARARRLRSGGGRRGRPGPGPRPDGPDPLVR